jgi:hypothetical protein
MFIPDLGSWIWIYFQPDPDFGSMGQKSAGLGSGSATLNFTQQFCIDKLRFTDTQKYRVP